MGKLTDAMERIKLKKQQHDNLGDHWNSRMNAVDETEERVKPMVEQVITAHETDLAEVEATVREMSNFPTEDSPKKPVASPATAHLGEGSKMAIGDLGPFAGPAPAPLPKAPQLVNPSTGDPIK